MQHVMPDQVETFGFDHRPEVARAPARGKIQQIAHAIDLGGGHMFAVQAFAEADFLFGGKRMVGGHHHMHPLRQDVQHLEID